MFKYFFLSFFYSQILFCQITVFQSGVQVKTLKFTPFAFGNKLKFWLDLTDKNKVFNDALFTNLAANNDPATILFTKNGIQMNAYFSFSNSPSPAVENSAPKYNLVNKTLEFGTSGLEYYPNGSALQNNNINNFRFYTHSDKRIIVAVVKTTSASNGILFGAGSAANSFLNNFDFVDVVNGEIRNHYCLYSPHPSNTPTAAIISSGNIINGFSIISLVVDPSFPNSGRSFYINGSLVGVNSATGVFTNNFTLFSIGAALKCCSGNGNPRHLPSLKETEIGEIIVLLDADTNSRLKLEGYVAWKWGLQSLLSSTHPYYSLAPSL